MNTLLIKKHEMQGVVVRDIERPSSEVINRLKEFYTGIILDHLGKYGAMITDIKPLSNGMKICGPAITSYGPDLSVRRMAIDLAKPGDVLVVAAHGIEDYACFGDGTAKRMQVKGMEGAIIDGSTRDSAGIRELNFPTFVRNVTPKNYHYPVSAEYGSVNIPVVCGGVIVNPGDIIFGDDDGVIVIPRDISIDLINSIENSLAEERRIRNSWTSYEPFSVETELRQRGYKFV
ncbi:RraA family protein [Bacillus cereus group sp. BfR-BA-01380]|uniref:RraA family protein n=1 Tax=Bacillus cereus group sp. BfR-BA-01380 TaxID=2920324 RepID=UPI001F580697|nr:RraA family protein [Bacillus cereus group sp. BfR-BA-01380]